MKQKQWSMDAAAGTFRFSTAKQNHDGAARTNVCSGASNLAFRALRTQLCTCSDARCARSAAQAAGAGAAGTEACGEVAVDTRQYWARC